MPHINQINMAFVYTNSMSINQNTYITFYFTKKKNLTIMKIERFSNSKKLIITTRKY